MLGYFFIPKECLAKKCSFYLSLPNMSYQDFSPESLNDLFTYILNKEKEIHDIYLLLRYSLKVSNSHYCPKNGITNFFHEKHLPTYYPGWSGRIWFTTYKEKDSKDYFTKYSVHLGSGGYGSYGITLDHLSNFCPYSYDVKIFIDDFPTIKSSSLLKLNNDLNTLTTIHVHKHN